MKIKDVAILGRMKIPTKLPPDKNLNQKDSSVAFLLIFPIKLHLLGFLRTVLKSAGSHDSKTVPENSN